MDAVDFGAQLPFLLGRYIEPGVATYLRYEGLRARYTPEAYLADRAEAAADVDADHWQGAVGRLLLVAGVEARRHHGNRPLVRDLHLYASDWPFDLGGIETPVGLWYGRADRIVPVGMGRYLAEAVPTAESHFYPDQAHVSVVESNEPAMVEWLRG
jgi:pimeloyl-ACP methyl ester carboxylesterase